MREVVQLLPISVEDGYDAMYYFLDAYWYHFGKPGDIGQLAGDMTLIGQVSVDAAAQEEWGESVAKIIHIKSERVKYPVIKDLVITVEQGYKAMVCMLELFQFETHSEETMELIKKMRPCRHVPCDQTEVWSWWVRSVRFVLSNTPRERPMFELNFMGD